ncbi:hypothetical protein KC351_g89 [Hortaea werneckii]|nr:hypothetical protein KC351_g89 [Hortaea werneckii]
MSLSSLVLSQPINFIELIVYLSARSAQLNSWKCGAKPCTDLLPTRNRYNRHVLDLDHFVPLFPSQSFVTAFDKASGGKEFFTSVTSVLRPMIHPLSAARREIAALSSIVISTRPWRHKADICNLPARNKSRELLAAEWSLFAIALLAVLLRLVARYLGTTTSGWDDVMLLVSMPLLIAMMTLQTMTTQWLRTAWVKVRWKRVLPIFSRCTHANFVIRRMDTNIFQLWKTITRVTIDEGLSQCQWITILLYTPQVTFVKFSIVLLYLRIFPSTVSKQFRLLCWIIIAAGVCFIIIGLLVFAFACQPVSISWSGLYEHNKDKCIHLPELYYLATCINLSTDVLIFVMPIPKVLVPLSVKDLGNQVNSSSSLKLDALSSRDKLITSIMFLLGLIATVAAGVRIAWVHKFLYTTNFTYDNAEFDVLYFVEISIGVTCACVPSCARLARKTWRSMRGYEDSHPASVDTFQASGVRSRAGPGGIQISQSFSQKRTTGIQAVSHNAEDEVELIDAAFGLRPDREKLKYSVKSCKYSPGRIRRVPQGRSRPLA